MQNPGPSDRRQATSLTRTMIVVAAAAIFFLLVVIVFRSCQGGTVSEDGVAPDRELPGEGATGTTVVEQQRQPAVAVPLG